MSPRLKVYSTMRARGCAQSARVVSWSQEPSVLLPLERPRGKAARHIPEMQKSWGEFHRWKGWRSGHKHLHLATCTEKKKSMLSIWPLLADRVGENTVESCVWTVCVRLTVLALTVSRCLTPIFIIAVCAAALLCFSASQLVPWLHLAQFGKPLLGLLQQGKQQRLINSHYGRRSAHHQPPSPPRGAQREATPACCIELQHRKQSVWKSTLKNWASLLIQRCWCTSSPVKMCISRMPDSFG